ncbi:CRP-like cAMP-binding protein [Bacilli bacterium PM5-3]|nr:CRP-like cAMP-binding protein [Bacilli bacterium PM5-3]
MIKYDEIFSSIEVFKGIPKEELTSILNCLSASISTYEKGDYILNVDDNPNYVGIILSGEVYILKDDIDGNRTLLSTLVETDIFAEALCCANIIESPVSVFANKKTKVLKLPFSHILNDCNNSCMFYQKLVNNMLKIVATKNLYLQNKLNLLSIKSIRKKVLEYLNSFSNEKSEAFSIPLNREKMAEYLNVDRSALSHELIKMKKDGLIDYNKNTFILFKR